jgi:hypothetical protein
LLVAFHLRLGLPSDFPSRFSSITIYAFFFLAARVTANISPFHYPNNAGCFKKSFTTLKENANLYREHTQRFEVP